MSKLNGVFTLRSPHDLRIKLEADLKRLRDADPSSLEAQYAAFDFFVCAEHIPDWLHHNEGGSKSHHRSYSDGAMVSHIANGAKHFQVRDNQHKSVRDTATTAKGFQAGGFQNRGFQVASLVIELEDGRTENVLEVANRVVTYWQERLP